MTWKIVGISEPIVGQTIVIERDMVIGRHQQADIVLQASHISRRHAALVLKDTQLWIQDLGSSNGTFVNGAKVSEQQLNVSDEIHFETIRFKVEQILAQAVEETVTIEPVSELKKEQPTDEGMRTLTERAEDIKLTSEGMPTNVGIPKPAPIPEHIDINNIQPEPEAKQAEVSESRVEKAEEQQKNAKVGLVSLFILIILIIIAVIAFGN